MYFSRGPPSGDLKNGSGGEPHERRNMTKRKYKAYTLWLKWKSSPGWARTFTVKDEGWPGENPILVIKQWIKWGWAGKYWEKRDWVILPEGKTPKGYKVKK